MLFAIFLHTLSRRANDAAMRKHQWGDGGSVGIHKCTETRKEPSKRKRAAREYVRGIFKSIRHFSREFNDASFTWTNTYSHILHYYYYYVLWNIFDFHRRSCMRVCGADRGRQTVCVSECVCRRRLN